MKYIYLAIKIIIFLALLLLAFKNTHDVEFFLGLTHQYTLPLIVLLGIFLVVGALLGILSILGKLLRLRSQAATFKKQLTQAQKEIEQLKVHLAASKDNQDSQKNKDV